MKKDLKVLKIYLFATVCNFSFNIRKNNVGIEIKNVSEEEKEAKEAQVLTTWKLLNQMKFRDNIGSIS